MPRRLWHKKEDQTTVSRSATEGEMTPLVGDNAFCWSCWGSWWQEEKRKDQGEMWWLQQLQVLGTTSGRLPQNECNGDVFSHYWWRRLRKREDIEHDSQRCFAFEQLELKRLLLFVKQSWWLLQIIGDRITITCYTIKKSSIKVNVLQQIVTYVLMVQWLAR